MNIQKVSEKTGYNPQYIRKCIQEGKLAAERTEMKGGGFRYDISKEAVEEFVNRPRMFTPDGRLTYIVKLLPEEAEAITKEHAEWSLKRKETRAMRTKRLASK